MGQRAVFLDRDGVIIAEVNYLRRVEQLRVLRGTPEGISLLRRAGFKVIVISNQSGVARGYVTRKALEGIHKELRRRLKVEGAALDAVYYCPHHPDEACRCRKPALGMIEAAQKRFKIDLKKSFFIGDSTSDMKTARNAGCAGVLVRTGKGGRDGRHRAAPVGRCRNLLAAARWIIRREARA